MNYNQIKVSRDERVGIITIDAPPMNGFSKRMIVEVVDCLDNFEKDDEIRTVMMKSTGPNFSQGAGFEDLDKDIVDGITDTPFSELGGKIVERIDTYPKPTLVAARGIIFGGSSAVFSAFDIRIVGETFNIHDGDIYYGIVGSWGMCSLRLPIWIGRNEIGLAIAKKMSTAAPVAARCFKECVRNTIYSHLAEARAKELEVSNIVWETEDAKQGLSDLIHGKKTDFKGK